MLNKKITFSLMLIQTGDAPSDTYQVAGDAPQWFSNALGISVSDTRIVRVHEGEILPAVDLGTITVISGSTAMLTDGHSWIESTSEWIRSAVDAEAPVFGVCFGHHLMAHALGGSVDYLENGREIGCKEITLTPVAADDVMLGSFPRCFMAHLTHSQTVTVAPSGSTILATSKLDKHQILRYNKNAMSVQFHPEFTPQILESIICAEADFLHEEGISPVDAISELQHTDIAKKTLSEFCRRYIGNS